MKTERMLPKLAVAVSAALIIAACDLPPPPSVPTPATEEQRAVQPGAVGAMRERQVAFLNRIREADPQQRTIERALINEHNELGLILDRRVPLDKIPALMRSMLTQMAREFPNEDLTVIAYTPSDPPHKIGTGRLNARTRDMTYTPEG